MASLAAIPVGGAWPGARRGGRTATLTDSWTGGPEADWVRVVMLLVLILAVRS